jgi:hypothetical protein
VASSGRRDQVAPRRSSNENMNSRKHEARVAGVLYLLMAAAAVVSLNNVPLWFMVGGDAAATADKIVSSQLLYRIGVVCDLAAQVLFVFTNHPSEAGRPPQHRCPQWPLFRRR